MATEQEAGRVGDAEQALVNEARAGLHPSGFDPSRITTKQFGRSWFQSYYGGKYVALGKTKREAVELAVQKLSSLHVPRQPAQCSIPMPALQSPNALSADAQAMSAGTVKEAECAI